MKKHLSETAISESFLAGTGPGGQNANKVATQVQLRINVSALKLPTAVMAQLRKLAGHRMSTDDILIITAREHRTRQANRIAARERAEVLITRAHQFQRKRKPTRPSRAAKAKRIDTKKQRGSVKRMRGRPTID